MGFSLDRWKQQWNDRFFRLTLVISILYLIGNVANMTNLDDYPVVLLITRVCLAGCLLLGASHSLRFLFVSKVIGPKLIMIINMVSQLKSIALASQNHLHKSNEWGRVKQGPGRWSTSWNPSDR